MGYILLAIVVLLIIYAVNKRKTDDRRIENQYENGMLDHEEKRKTINLTDQYATEIARESTFDNEQLKDSTRDRSDERNLEEEIERNKNQ